jgi:hypothetical protein
MKHLGTNSEIILDQKFLQKNMEQLIQNLEMFHF